MIFAALQGVPLADATIPSDAVSAIVQTGAIGGLLILAVYGMWKLYQRIINNADEQRVRAEKAEAENRELNKEIRTYFAQLTSATQTLASVVEQLKRGQP